MSLNPANRRERCFLLIAALSDDAKEGGAGYTNYAIDWGIYHSIHYSSGGRDDIIL